MRYTLVGISVLLLTLIAGISIGTDDTNTWMNSEYQHYVALSPVNLSLIDVNCSHSETAQRINVTIGNTSKEAITDAIYVGAMTFAKLVALPNQTIWIDLEVNVIGPKGEWLGNGGVFTDWAKDLIAANYSSDAQNSYLSRLNTTISYPYEKREAAIADFDSRNAKILMSQPGIEFASCRLTDTAMIFYITCGEGNENMAVQVCLADYIVNLKATPDSKVDLYIIITGGGEYKCLRNWVDLDQASANNYHNDYLDRLVAAVLGTRQGI